MPDPEIDATVPPNASTTPIAWARPTPNNLRKVLGVGLGAKPTGDSSTKTTLSSLRSSPPTVAALGPTGEAGRHGERAWSHAGSQLVKRQRGLQPEGSQCATAALVGGDGQGATALGEVEPHEGRGGLFIGRISFQAGLPGFQHLLRASTAHATSTVAGQLQACLLAQVLDPLPYPGRPVGLRLVFERDASRR